jgi:hypothetical protein
MAGTPTRGTGWLNARYRGEEGDHGEEVQEGQEEEQEEEVTYVF